MTATRSVTRFSSGRQHLHEAVSSIAIATALLTALLHANENYWSGRFFGWTLELNDAFHRRASAAFGAGLAFYIWSAVLGVLIFLLLVLSSRLTSIRRMLSAIVGVAVVAAPTVCLWFVELHQPGHVYEGGALLRLEGGGAAAGAILYACKLWPFSARSTLLFLLCHSILWTHAYWITFEYLGLWWLIVPVSAFAASVTWGYFGKAERQE